MNCMKQTTTDADVESGYIKAENGTVNRFLANIWLIPFFLNILLSSTELYSIHFGGAF